jgi:hypothetical protein
MSYWDEAELMTYKEVAEAVESYLGDAEEWGMETPNISFAPLSDEVWELVGFAPAEVATMAVLDSVYCDPTTAKQIQAKYPMVETMDLS